jgi:hypothetical protein
LLAITGIGKTKSKRCFQPYNSPREVSGNSAPMQILLIACIYSYFEGQHVRRNQPAPRERRTQRAKSGWLKVLIKNRKNTGGVMKSLLTVISVYSLITHKIQGNFSN